MKTPLFKRLSRQWRGRLRCRSLAAHGVAIVAQTRNGLLAVQPGDFSVSRELLEHGEYDWKSIQWLKRLLAPGARMIFAGAHLGALLVPLALACPGCEVLAFEPSPRNLRLLKMNLALNHLESVRVRNVALGATRGRTGFVENRINSGNSHVAQDAGEIEVDIAPLDGEVPADWPRIDLMVMDVEGSEVAAMRGAHATLARTRYLYVEFAPEQLSEQDSSAAEFLDIAARQFRSAYIFSHAIQYLGPSEFVPYLTGLQHQRALLLNVLLCKDETLNPALTGMPG